MSFFYSPLFVIFSYNLGNKISFPTDIVIFHLACSVFSTHLVAFTIPVLLHLSSATEGDPCFQFPAHCPQSSECISQLSGVELFCWCSCHKASIRVESLKTERSAHWAAAQESKNNEPAVIKPELSLPKNCYDFSQTVPILQKCWAAAHSGCVRLPVVIASSPTAFNEAMANASHQPLQQQCCYRLSVSALEEVSNLAPRFELPAIL